jgi:hypothetical protein
VDYISALMLHAQAFWVDGRGQEEIGGWFLTSIRTPSCMTADRAGAVLVLRAVSVVTIQSLRFAVSLKLLHQFPLYRLCRTRFVAGSQTDILHSLGGS